MSFIKSFFKSDNNNTRFPWKTLQSENQIVELIKESHHKTVAVFKHSTRCGVSRMVLNRFEKQSINLENVVFYYLDLLQYRDLSDALASQFKITHQSPQLIVLKNGEVETHSSHFGLLEITI
ncbi:MAG: bacillithiol system redox-active protein YtxJ [Flavobacteriaceae bacterium]|nr:bacillithiol system redox-active protein YtxJ [Flavobacteriaceae bacterium]